MKRTAAIFCLFLIAPFQSWATFPVAQLFSIDTIIHVFNLAKKVASFALQKVQMGLQVLGNSISMMDYQQNSAPIGMGVAAAPGYYTNAATNIKIHKEAKVASEELAMLREALIKDATVMEISPREISKKVFQKTGGDWKADFVDIAQRKFNQAKEQLVEQFTMERLAQAAAQFTQDILACRTPQIDAVFPSFNLDADLGLLMCDYKEMFSDMKDQVNTISQRDWGETFTINGRKASEVIKDGDLLKDAIQMVPPSMGRKLAVDALADQSIDASVQASVDASAIMKEMDAIMSDDKRKFKATTVVDLLDDSLKMQYKMNQVNVANANAANRIQAAQAQMTAIEQSERSERAMGEDLNNMTIDLISPMYE